MIWLVAQQICVILYYICKPQKESLPEPVSLSSMASFGGKLSEWIPQLKEHFGGKLSEWVSQLKGYFGGKLSEWTPLLAHHSFVHHDSWMMKCPKYLFDCCPLVKTEDDDSDILNRLADLNPVHAFFHIFLRRLAEVIVQLVANWLIIIWIIAFMTFIWFSLFPIQQKICKTTKSVKRSSSTKWNLKYIWLFLLLLLPLMSFAAFYTHDSVLITYLPQRVTSDRRRFFSTLWDLISWKNKRHSQDLLNILDFFQFSKLYLELYSEDKPLKICKTSAEQLCRATKISLSCSSVLIFIFVMYSIFTLGLYVFVWLPLTKIFSRFYKAGSKPKHLLSDIEFKKRSEKITNLKLESGSKYSLSGKGDASSTKEEKKIRNLKLESGDAPEIRNRNLKYRPPTNAVKLRYVTRGVKACLDDEDF